MGKIIMIASGKGGTGKTTAAANIGAALAARGCMTVLVDMDMGLRNLDIALGLESEIVYDFTDLIEGRCTLDDVLIKAGGYESLFFIASPQTRPVSEIEEEKLKNFWEQLRNRFDFCIADSPAGIGTGFMYTAAGADTVLITALAETAALRDADRAVSALTEKGVEDIRLLLNRIRPELMEKKLMPNADECMDMLGIPVIGIVPDDELLIRAALRGEPAVGVPGSAAGAAFLNIAARLCGENVPIMDFKKKSFWAKLKEAFEK